MIRLDFESSPLRDFGQSVEDQFRWCPWLYLASFWLRLGSFFVKKGLFIGFFE